ncbi:MAG: hypothetical protein PUH29_05440, partial [Lachnospiraceae bacterium]|nr:hypothetical protein [Lachnospiraceae bacterium]
DFFFSFIKQRTNMPGFSGLPSPACDPSDKKTKVFSFLYFYPWPVLSHAVTVSNIDKSKTAL